jgi:2,3-dihydroxybenzoate decarboxylase
MQASTWRSCRTVGVSKACSIRPSRCAWLAKRTNTSPQRCRNIRPATPASPLCRFRIRPPALTNSNARCGQLGMKGAMLFGTTNGKYLDDDRFAPFWERVEALGCPIYLHAADAPIMPVGLVGRPELLAATWGWTAETATHALRLVTGGVFGRYPGVQLILGHMGETLPYILWRLDRRVQAFSASDKPPAKPSDLIKRNIAMTTAGVCSNTSLTCALDSIGTESVMFSVDHPFESMDDSSAWLDAAPVSSVQQEALSWRNAQRILKL